MVKKSNTTPQRNLKKVTLGDCRELSHYYFKFYFIASRVGDRSMQPFINFLTKSLKNVFSLFHSSRITLNT